MRTKASEAFGAYGTRPVDLHGDWYLVSFHARLIGMELIALCKDPADLRLPVGPDWRETLCAKMCVSGPDRRNAKAAMDKLVAAGFLLPEDGFARVSLVPLRIHSGSTSVPLRSQFGSTPDSNPSEVPVTIKVESPSRKEGKQGREGGARAEVFNFRQPLGDPPPGLPPAEPPLVERIVSAHAKRYSELRNGESGKRDYRAATEVARWCEANAGVHKTTAPELAMRVVAGLFASDRAGARRWPLSWAATDAAEFLAPPPGCKPVASTKEQIEAGKQAAIASQTARLRKEFADRIKAARDQGDDYEVEILAAERDQRLSRLQSQAS